MYIILNIQYDKIIAQDIYVIVMYNSIYYNLYIMMLTS